VSASGVSQTPVGCMAARTRMNEMRLTAGIDASVFVMTAGFRSARRPAVSTACTTSAPARYERRLPGWRVCTTMPVFVSSQTVRMTPVLRSSTSRTSVSNVRPASCRRSRPVFV
jgi:hypothetical protein